jgi:hypothetical protein
MTEVVNDVGNWEEFSHTEPKIECGPQPVKEKDDLDKMMNPLDDTSDLYEVKELLKLKDSKSVLDFLKDKSRQQVALAREHLLISLAYTTDWDSFIIEFIRLLTRIVLGDLVGSEDFDKQFKDLEDIQL